MKWLDKTRIQNKHDTEANWAKATTFKPLAGELIIYDKDSNNAKPRFKIGDGITTVTSLPFVAIDYDSRITSLESNAMPKSGGTFTGEVKFGSTENFQGYYIKRMIGSLGAGTAYNNLDPSYKDGTWHRMWRLRFPSGSSFWGKIKITLYGGYSSFNASGVMSKSITCNFNTSTIYNNVGCYDGLGVNVEQDFRISEAIWNATVNAWEVLIWQKNLKGNNSPTIMLECWTTNNTKYIKAFNGITAQTVELTQSTSYSAQKASPTGGTKTVTWATLPVYENPLGEEIATMSDLPNISGKANLSGGNIFDSQQIFEDITGTITINGSYVTIQPTGAQGAYSFEVLNSNNTTAFSINGDSSGRIKVGSPVELGNGFGTSGQVLTSQGAGETPTWTTPAIKSVLLSGTTLTITL